MDNDISKKRDRLVSQIYESALNPGEYNHIFEAWDDHFEALPQDRRLSEPADFEWMDDFIGHFDRAGQLFQKLETKKEVPLAERLAAMDYAALVCDQNGVISECNERAEKFFGLVGGGSIFDQNLEPQSAKLLKAFFVLPEKSNKVELEERAIIRIYDAEANSANVFLTEYILPKGDPETKVQVLMRSIQSNWHNRVAEALHDAFNLTKAELDLLENLYRGLTVKEIANWKSKSQATLRSQLSSLLQKTGTSSQADLSRLTASIVTSLDKVKNEKQPQILSSFRRKQPFQRRYSLEISQEFTFDVVESGDLSGRPFFFVQTTTWPTLTKRIVKSLAMSGVRLVSVMRSGVGKTTKASLSMNPGDWAAVLLQAVDKIGPKEGWIFGGQCSGGIFALEMASRAGSVCKGVFLVDTGAPLQSAEMIYQMHKSPRRLFLAARFFPLVLTTPYNLVHADFYSGREGEERAVSYFLDGSPTDEKLMSDPYFWRIVRDNFDYVMRNHRQGARDLTFWSRNTTNFFKSALKNAPIHFYHGQDNFVHLAANIEKFCDRHTNATHRIVPDHGQLLIYVKPELFAEEIARFQARVL